MSWNAVNGVRSSRNKTDGVMATAALEAESSFIRSSMGKPHTAMLSLASVMLATTATAQEALPTIDVQDNAGNGTGYQATAPQVSRIPTPLLDTPQTAGLSAAVPAAGSPP